MEPATGALLHTFTIDDEWITIDNMWIYGAAFGPNGSTVAIAMDGDVHLYDTITGQLIYRLQADLFSTIHKVVFNADGSMLATSGDDGVIRLWNVAMLTQR
jgi:WD40 repeat protein